MTTQSDSEEYIQGGFYIKARCIQNSWIAHAQPIVREVWDYLIREANHKDQKYNGFIIKRGQLFRSYREIRDALKWRIGYRFQRYHESSMKRAMKALMTERMIELVSEPRGNLITILNYDKYQDISNYARTDDRTDARTNGEPVANQYRSAINKNVKNEKNINNDHFDAFWQAYPRKVGKLQAQKAWKKIKQPAAMLSDILEALKIQCNSEQWKKDNGQYIPHPATWLNQGRWMDEIDKPKQPIRAF